MSVKPPAPSDTADKFMLRLPDGMRDRLKAEAASSNRSLNAEIVHRLQESMGNGDQQTSDAGQPQLNVSSDFMAALGEGMDTFEAEPPKIMALRFEAYQALAGDIQKIKKALDIKDD